MNRYPRDMAGMSAKNISPNWPGQAKIAVQIVLNFEEGGENNILHGDAASEAFLSEITGAQPWPGQRHWNMETIYEYGSRAGYWRLHQLLSDMPVTVFGVATAMARSPEILASMQDANWEIASHGMNWIEHKDMSPDQERQEIKNAIALHTELTGSPPRGWYTGRCSMNTIDLVAAEGSFAYIADSYADDLPYWVRAGDKDQLIVPYTLDCNDMRFAIQAGFTHGDPFEQYIKDSFDVLYAEGEQGAPKMLSIGLHCRLVGRPGRFAALKRALEYIKSHQNVWFATRLDIAEHWANHHPPMNIRRASEMNLSDFVDTFGGVFEHSPWIAKRAWELEMGFAHDNPIGVHSVLVRAFRSASDDERLAVLRAHPDLAGKLAQADRLTVESTQEQASAGLNALTDNERARFMELNEKYTSKFGFPFIIAVRDQTKDSIMQLFTQRIENERDDEMQEACRQVERIAKWRLIDMFPL